MTNTELNNALNNFTDMFILIAKECGFTTPKEIENNFETIAFVGSEMQKQQRDRILTKLNTNPDWIKYLAARYQKRVNEEQ